MLLLITKQVVHKIAKKEGDSNETEKQTMGHSRTQLDFNIEVYRLFKSRVKQKAITS